MVSFYLNAVFKTETCSTVIEVAFPNFDFEDTILQIFFIQKINYSNQLNVIFKQNKYRSRSL